MKNENVLHLAVKAMTNSDPPLKEKILIRLMIKGNNNVTIYDPILVILKKHVKENKIFKS